MRAVVYRGIERVEVAEVPDAVLVEPSDAIVRVRLTAICGSDLHLYHGKAPLEPGDTIGHEAIGVVDAVGSSVKRFAPGDRVVCETHAIVDPDGPLARAGLYQLDPGRRGYGATVKRGVVVREDDELTGARPGRLLRGPQPLVS